MPLAMSYVLQLAMLEPSLLLMSWCFFMFLVRLYNFYFLFADRESEPNSWHDELDRKKYPRMPWHDVHCALWVPPCCDIARHFVQRWNHAKVYKMMLFHLKRFIIIFFILSYMVKHIIEN